MIEDESHPALISKTQYEPLQQMAKPANKDVRSKRKQKSYSPYLLTFNFNCKSCNGQVIGRNHIYVCGAPLYTVPYEWLESEVLKGLGLVYDDVNLIMLLKNVIAEGRFELPTFGL